MNKRIQDFLKEIISFHGFSSNTFSGYSCYIPDPKPFSTKEGLLLWVCSPKRKTIVTKIEHLVKTTRKARFNNMIGISKQEFNKEFLPKIIDYSYILHNQFAFQRIGKGVSVSITPKIYNRSLKITNFKNDLKLLRDFEVFLINNPITEFAVNKGYFTVRGKNKLLFDNFF